jgi:RNA polymerase-binding transcription factor DksA
MRRHFHRCGHLRILSVDAGDLSGARKGGSQILEELCEVKGLARCLGLADCDVLSAAQKRDLLGTRATQMREEEGGESPLADLPHPRAKQLRELRSELALQREQIVAENRRRLTESAGAVLRNPRPLRSTEEWELRGAGVSVFLDEELRELQTTRLDAIDRALDAMARGVYGNCVRCRRPIDVERLREAPDTLLCPACASEALPVA